MEMKIGPEMNIWNQSFCILKCFKRALRFSFVFVDFSLSGLFYTLAFSPWFISKIDKLKNCILCDDDCLKSLTGHFNIF